MSLPIDLSYAEQKRRKELEIFLNRVAAHKELSGSQYFKTFLQVGVFTVLGLLVARAVHKENLSAVGKLRNLFFLQSYIRKIFSCGEMVTLPNEGVVFIGIDSVRLVHSLAPEVERILGICCLVTSG